MSGWQIGDLALCTKNKPWQGVFPGGLAGVFDGPRAGAVLCVREVSRSLGYTWLWFNEWPNLGEGEGFDASRFRKITPPKADEFDREIIDLMAGKKVDA